MDPEKFAPFQPVLVCNGPGDVWHKAFYDRRVNSHYGFNHMMIGGVTYKYCRAWDVDNDLSGEIVEEVPSEA